MPYESESAFVTKMPSLNEEQKNDIVNIIKSNGAFQDAKKELESKNLIWYFIDVLQKDENNSYYKEIKQAINNKGWEEQYKRFHQSIIKASNDISNSSDLECIAYPSDENHFNIRFENSEVGSIEISKILEEGKTYNISLGGDSQVIAKKQKGKNGNERHYKFVGSNSCKMTINWQAKDAEGKNVDCSITVEVGSGGIKEVIEEEFGGVTDQKAISELIKQNKEVVINGLGLHAACAYMDKAEALTAESTPKTIFSRGSSVDNSYDSSTWSNDFWSPDDPEFEKRRTLLEERREIRGIVSTQLSETNADPAKTPGKSR